MASSPIWDKPHLGHPYLSSAGRRMSGGRTFLGSVASGLGTFFAKHSQGEALGFRIAPRDGLGGGRMSALGCSVFFLALTEDRLGGESSGFFEKTLGQDALILSLHFCFEWFAIVRARATPVTLESGFVDSEDCGRLSSVGRQTSNREKGSAKAGSDRCFLLREGCPRRIVGRQRQFFRRKSNIYCYSSSLEYF